MSEYRCSQCGSVYNRYEYDALDKQLMNPDNEDEGYERICECGAGFHSDKWNIRETVEHGDEEFNVSTVALLIPHGRDHDQWFETCVFHDYGSSVVRRYHTQDKAEAGHEIIVEQLESGEFSFETTGKRLEL